MKASPPPPLPFLHKLHGWLCVRVVRKGKGQAAELQEDFSCMCQFSLRWRMDGLETLLVFPTGCHLPGVRIKNHGGKREFYGSQADWIST